MLDEIDQQRRPAIQSLTYDALRTWAYSQKIIKQFLSKKPTKEIHCLLALAITLMIRQRQAQAHNQYSLPTIVNESVKAAAMSPKTAHAQGLINAVLRKLSMAEEHQKFLDNDLGIPYPKWWINRIRSAYPKEWEDICREQQKPPPLILRVNTKKNSRQQYGTKLDSENIQYTSIDQIANLAIDTAMLINKPVPVSRLPEFDHGAVSIQDAGAQLAPILLKPAIGDRLLDACAAPGGKTAHLLESVATDGLVLVALEIDTERTKKIQNTINRLGLASDSVNVVTGDASKQDWWNGVLFDKIILDVPCSASGIVRRHPDIVFLRREEDINNLVKTQRAILENAWQMLRNQGLLLYLTCSIFPEEGEQQIQEFVQAHPNALRLEAPGQLLPKAHHDGFFYGLLKKTDS